MAALAFASFGAGLSGRPTRRGPDNRADPRDYDGAIHGCAWETQFNSVGVRAESTGGWTAIAQYLDGQTYFQPGEAELAWPFKARFGLLSKQLGPRAATETQVQLAARFALGSLPR
jgi:hypothetical protein